jgi:hypothetical protein
VFWNDNLLDTVGGNLTAGAVNGQLHSGPVPAQDNHLLRFAAVGHSDRLGGSLDAVSLIVAVPEPGPLRAEGRRSAGRGLRGPSPPAPRIGRARACGPAPSRDQGRTAGVSTGMPVARTAR